MKNQHSISRRDFLRLAGGTLAAAKVATFIGCHDDDRKKSENTIQPQDCVDAVDILLAEGQKIDAVKESLSYLDLPSILEGTAIGTLPDAAQVHQYLRFGPFASNAPQSSAVWNTQNELDQTGDFLYFKDGDRIFEYQLDFENGLTSQVSGNTLIDLLDKHLPVLGVQRRIVKAKRAGDLVDLILMAGEFKSQAAAFGPQTYIIDGKEYEVNVPYASSEFNGDAQYAINGELTPALSPGEPYVLADGTRFGHVTAKGTNSEAMIVDFAFNADILEWADDTTQDGFESTYMPARNGELIEDAKVRITGTTLPDGTFELSTIRYALLADGKQGDIYIGKGGSLRDQLDEPAGIPGRLDIIYAGQNADNKHIVRICAQ